MKFKAAIFDFDGTITEKGVAIPSREMVDALAALSRKMPIAFCTGRQLESFEAHTELKNVYLMAENGSIGYYFNTDLGCFEEFYRTKWPDSFIQKEKLKEILANAIKEFGKIHHSEKYPSHRVIIVLTSKEKRGVHEVYRVSDKIYEATISELRKISPDYERFLHVGNSGIGVVVCPADGDKDNGIKRFAEFLALKRGIVFNDECFREILVAGDQGEKGGNDYYFLNGELGTPFTVGEGDTAKSVLDDKGQKLLHGNGLLHLINSVLTG